MGTLTATGSPSCRLAGMPTGTRCMSSSGRPARGPESNVSWLVASGVTSRLPLVVPSLGKRANQRAARGLQDGTCRKVA